MSVAANPFPTANRLTRALSEESRRQLRLVQLDQYAVLPEDDSRSVYFPVGCVASLLTSGEDGAIAQAAMVGTEGMLSIDAFLGGRTRISGAIGLVVVAGPAWQLDEDVFRHDLESNFALQQRLMRYTLSLVSEMAHTAACRRQHSGEQQVCRWLLQVRDRAGAVDVQIAPESLATLLGLPRDTVGEAVRGLIRFGLLEQRGPRLRLRRPEGLEMAGCGCHRAIGEVAAQALLHPAAVPAAAALAPLPSRSAS
jgi:CRP-like cAMP-binding protein